MIAAGRRSKTSRDRLPRSSRRRPSRVPKVSTNRPTGSALPIAYATWTSQRDGEARGDDVLGDPAHRVRGRAVDLGRVLAGEGAAAVAGHAAVGVDDDLAAGQTGVAHRAADLEAAGGVDQQAVALGVQLDAVVEELPSARARRRTRGCRGRAASPGRCPLACCEETTTVSRRTALSPSYSMVTWVLPSGRRYGMVPFLRTSDRRLERRCARWIGSGISSASRRIA